jgi:hypothetical protein
MVIMAVDADEGKRGRAEGASPLKGWNSRHRTHAKLDKAILVGEHMSLSPSNHVTYTCPWRETYSG